MKIKWPWLKVVAQKTSAEEAFESWFVVTPNQIGEQRVQKEVMFKLATLAAAVKQNAKLLGNAPDNEFTRYFYNECLARYESACASLDHFLPELGAVIPHWSEFPQFLKDWIKGDWQKGYTEVKPAAHLQLVHQ